MVHLGQFILLLLSLTGTSWLETSIHTPSQHPVQLDVYSASAQSNVTKAIAIVGAGSAGLAVLKTLLDLPENVRSNWRIVCYEQRRDVGGVWLPDISPPSPPTLPETPLYPLLRTNTPHPTMTYPGFPFPPNTPLFPSWEYVERYHVAFAERFNLTTHIRLNHTIVAAGWHGDYAAGKWELEITRTDLPSPQSEHEFFDHLIVANGHNHYPRIPHWDGEDAWLQNTPAGTPKREILHSIFYREPERYINRTVVIVGGGASGRDAALQIGPLATVYHSLHNSSTPPDGAKVTMKPPILRFTDEAVIFTDGSSLSSIDSVLLGTGYQTIVPFLSRLPTKSQLRTPTLITNPGTDANSSSARTLTTNTRYIFPLYEDIFSLSPQLPSTALSFVGLPILIANCPSDIAQSLLVSHAIADPSTLPSRMEMLESLLRREESRRSKGLDPYYVGHKMVGGDTEAQDYQDKLVQYLKERGKLPNDGKKYVEDWRRSGREESALIGRAWARVEKEGSQAVWLEGVSTERQWAELLRRLAVWQEKWETEHGEYLLALGSDDDYGLY